MTEFLKDLKNMLGYFYRVSYYLSIKYSYTRLCFKWFLEYILSIAQSNSGGLRSGSKKKYWRLKHSHNNRA